MADRFYVQLHFLDRLVTRSILMRNAVVARLLAIYGVEVPSDVVIGAGFRFRHANGGLVVHPRTVFGANVTVYHGVTIGRSHMWEPEPRGWPGVRIGDDAILCAGAVILGGRNGTTVGRGTVVGANAVLTTSTGEWEIWAGAPARCVGVRSQESTV